MSDNAKKPKISQVLPSIRRLPRVKIDRALAEQIDQIVSRAQKTNKLSEGEDSEILAAAFAVTRVETAIGHFVSEKAHEIDLPSFREMVSVGNRASVARAMNNLVDLLNGGDNVPPFAQMRALYCYGDPASNGNESTDSNKILAEQQEREDQWDERLSVDVLRESLGRWLALVNELREYAGKARSPVAARLSFVRSLASYWTEELKAPLGSSRNETKSVKPGGKANQHGQRGLFAQFVHKAAEGIPQEFRRGEENWDHAIREISEKKS
jgi:hypothetical protein